MNLKASYRGLVLLGVGALVIGAFVLRDGGAATPNPEVPIAAETAAPKAQRKTVRRPRFVDLGSDRCRSCKAMIPVIAELRARYPQTLEVSFVDVWDDPDKGKEYGVSTIPTQILFDPDGNELERHVGFWSVAKVVARLEALGYPQVRTEDPK